MTKISNTYYVIRNKSNGLFLRNLRPIGAWGKPYIFSMTDQINLAKKYNKIELALKHVLSAKPATEFEVVKIEAIIEYTVYPDLDAEESNRLARERLKIIAEADKERKCTPTYGSPQSHTVMLGDHAKDYKI